MLKILIGAMLLLAPIYAQTRDSAPHQSTVHLVAGLPATCSFGQETSVSDATVSAGGTKKYFCIATNTWAQIGYVAGGSGALLADCSTNPCTIDVTSIVMLKASMNVVTGGLDVSGGSFSAPFRIASSAPATCDATKAEFYVNTTSHLLFQCTATNTWTQVGGGATTTAWSLPMIAVFHNNHASGSDSVLGNASDTISTQWGTTAAATTGFFGAMLPTIGDHIMFATILPPGMTGALSLTVSSSLQVSNTGTGTYTLSASSGCIADGAALDGHTFNAAQNFSQTIASIANAKLNNVNTITLDNTGCAANNLILIDVKHVSNSGTSDPPIVGFLRLSGTRTL